MLIELITETEQAAGVQILRLEDSEEAAAVGGSEEESVLLVVLFYYGIKL